MYLEGSRELIGERLATRARPCMPASLLDSQFATLQPPAPEEHAITVSVDAPVASSVARIAAALSLPGTMPGELRTTG